MDSLLAGRRAVVDIPSADSAHNIRLVDLGGMVADMAAELRLDLEYTRRLVVVMRRNSRSARCSGELHKRAGEWRGCYGLVPWRLRSRRLVVRRRGRRIFVTF